MRRLSVVVVGVALMGVAACGSSGSSGSSAESPTSTAISPSHVHLSLHTVVSGLSSPVSVTNSGDGSGRLFVDEQAGEIRVVRSGQLVSAPYLDIRSKVTSGGEQGLLSAAFHPNFAKHPKVYVAYTRGDGDLVVSSFSASSARASHVSSATERRILLIRHHSETNHNGGQIFFGPDGYLYVTTGDGGGEGDPFKRADKRDNLTGKILRINVNKSCGSKRYCIPPSNPYAHSSRFRPEILDWGFRNPWRVSIDPSTRTLWIGDVGQNSFEEIDHTGIKAAHDFGWSCKEGRTTFNAGECGHRNITGPVQVIPHSPGGNCAIIGGDVYRGKKYAVIAGGLYIYSDNCSGRIWGLRKVNGHWHNAQIGSVSGGPAGFGLSQAGTLYLVTLDGVLHRASFSRA